MHIYIYIDIYIDIDIFVVKKSAQVCINGELALHIIPNNNKHLFSNDHQSVCNSKQYYSYILIIIVLIE